MATDKTKELLEQLEKGVLEVFDDVKFQAFLRVQSIFSKYSYRNAMLIYMQKPNATVIEGYKSWQKKFDRFVMKGEKSITIIAPQIIKPKDIGKETDPNIDPKNQGYIRFRAIPVFDVSQTDGKPMPQLKVMQLDGNSISSQKIIDAIKSISEVPIAFEHINDGSKGYYHIADHRIAIKTGMSLDQTAKTMVHEYAHSLLHHKDSVKSDRHTKEVQAESVAYVVSNHLGVDTSDYSFDYVAGWSKGRELKELHASLDVIQKTSKDVIEKIEGYLERQMEINTNVPKDIGYYYDLFDQINKVYPDVTKISEGQSFQPSLSTDIITVGNKLIYEYDSSVKAVTKIDAVSNVVIEDYYNMEEVRSDIISNIKTELLTQHYSPQFKSFSKLEPDTIKAIDDINHKHDRVHTIEEIKEKYNEKGKAIETDPSPENINDFNELKAIVDDFKSATLKDKQIKAQEKAQEMNQVKSMEMSI